MSDIKLCSLVKFQAHLLVKEYYQHIKTKERGIER